MKKILLSILGIFIVLVVFLAMNVNKEDLTAETKYMFLNSEELKQDKDLYLLIIFSSMCPSIEDAGPNLKEQLQVLKDMGIKYYIVADELYAESTDELLDGIVSTYNLEGETIYLMDINEFPTNGGLFNNKARYADFTNNLTNGAEILLFYPQYIIMNNGELVDSYPAIRYEILTSLSATEN